MAVILIADDDDALRRAMVAYLASRGHVVREAADGAAAWEIAASAPALDLLVADVQMPRLDGIALAARCRARFPDLAVLLASGDTVAPGAIAGPAVATVEKPFGLSVLGREIDELLRRRRPPG